MNTATQDYDDIIAAIGTDFKTAQAKNNIERCDTATLDQIELTRLQKLEPQRQQIENDYKRWEAIEKDRRECGQKLSDKEMAYATSLRREWVQAQADRNRIPELKALLEASAQAKQHWEEWKAGKRVSLLDDDKPPAPKENAPRPNPLAA